MGALAPLIYKINYFKSDPFQYKNLLNNLEELRKSAGLTQQDLSESAGVSRKSINAIENGIYIPENNIRPIESKKAIENTNILRQLLWQRS